MHYQILKVDFPLANISISTLKGIIKNEFWKSKPLKPNKTFDEKGSCR